MERAEREKQREVEGEKWRERREAEAVRDLKVHTNLKYESYCFSV